MSDAPLIHLLAGTAEARALSAQISGVGWALQVHVTEASRLAQSWPGQAVAVRSWQDMALRNARCVIDARHPFDQGDALPVEAWARAHDVPFLRLRRPAWRPGPGDRWACLPSEHLLPQVVPRGMRLLTATGRDGLRAMRRLKDCYIFVRQLDPHPRPFPLPRGRWLFDPGPFTLPQEMALMRKLRIDGIVVRNAGGQGAWPKLAAARRLGVPVVLIDPPRVSAQARTVEEAMVWLRQRLDG